MGYKDLCIIQLPLVNELSFISLASRVIVEYVYTLCFVAIATRISGWQKNFVANYNVFLIAMFYKLILDRILCFRIDGRLTILLSPTIHYTNISYLVKQ